MAMESIAQPTLRTNTGLGGAHPRGPVLGTEASAWLLARMADAGGEVVLGVEADERFWRIRRTAGATASMFELALTAPASAMDVATALLRWASTVGLAGRILDDTAGPLRVGLASAHAQD